MDDKDNCFESESSMPGALSNRWVRLAMIWVAWTLVGLFFTSQVVVSTMYMEKRPPLGKVLLMQMSICPLWALATPLVWWLARRFCIEWQNWRRRILFHLVVGLLLVSM